ncbi:hypothetical protein NCCP2716_22060 [Sporosarcina sp. NCCP-2716]|nr:hypothetical protein NCCP2716_22060 [Sporosarcina sp. NCCP-2716]
MNYVNAKQILPDELLAEIQQYIHGETLYIPKRNKERLKWGTATGSRHSLDERNEQIRSRFFDGAAIGELATAYCLSSETIKKIVYIRK